MRQHKLFSAAISVVMFLITISGSALADLATQRIVDGFNAMNNGKGYSFQSMT